jgi:hypothetical protein
MGILSEIAKARLVKGGMKDSAGWQPVVLRVAGPQSPISIREQAENRQADHKEYQSSP